VELPPSDDAVLGLRQPADLGIWPSASPSPPDIVYMPFFRGLDGHPV